MSAPNQENQEPTLQIPSYPSIDTIEIEESVLSQLLKFQESKTIEGILFGRETGSSVLVSSAIPCALAQPTVSSLTSYLEVNRMDYMKVGFFCFSEDSEVINKEKLKIYVEFQKTFPNAVIIFLDSNMKNANMYPFKCFRMHKVFMEMVDLCEVEEDSIAISGSNGNSEDFYQNIYKKFVETKQILQKLKFSIVEDEKKLFRVLAEKETYEEEDQDNEIGKGIQQNPFKYSLNKKISELNKNCEKFIDEQKNYINYYKMKKTYGKAKEREFLEQLTKKGNELSKMDKIDISLTTKNIQNMNEQIKNLMKKNEINNFTNLKITN